LLVGYARTSSTEQIAGFEDQQAALVATGCTKIFSEQISSVAKRDQLEAALEFVREGDVLIATRLDRIARSTAHLLSIIERLEAKHVGLRITDFGGGEIDTQSPTGRLLITVLGAVAECERALILDRQRAGIARAKAAGKYRGRAPTARRRATEIMQLRSDGRTPSEIAKQTGVSRSSVYRILAEAG